MVPWFTAKGLDVIVAMKKTVSRWKTWSKQNPMILGGGYWVYTLRDTLGLLVVAKGASTTWATWPDMVHGPTAQKTVAQHHGRFWTSHCFDDSRWLRSWGWIHWKAYLLSFPCICRTSKTITICDLGVIFSVYCSWTPRWTWTWVVLGLQLGDSNQMSFGPPSWLGKTCWSPSSSCHSPSMVICIHVMSSSSFKWNTI